MPQNIPKAPTLFHPRIHQWFLQRVGRPTEAQQEGWTRIAAGEHVLITAPTGSGKTLTAFLWSLNQLIRQIWSGGCTRVLYISPLKALNNDVQRNLITPLSELKTIFEQENLIFPDINVKTRSGDTPHNDRRRMLRHPPEILITTPESLNLLLSSAGGRSLLGSITTVILDEIHAVVGNKRGVYLISAVDRLVRLSGEFQRICLSATINPLDSVARFVGGYQLTGSIAAPRYTPREMAVIRGDTPKQYQVKVAFPGDAATRKTGESIWKPLVREFKRIIENNRATLLFTNSRRLCEKLTLYINQGEHQTTAYAHHGSLSREIREVVESKLKHGDLKAIVATNSLELGIDIGDLDEVILIQSPPSVSAAVQRVGRAGHRLGQVSRGTFFPTHSHDFLEAAVLAQAISKGDIEEISPVQCPLDVLAQIMISMVGVETWDRDELFAWLKTSHPFHHLSRTHYDLVLNMLAGRYAHSRIRELKPRISIDGLDHTIAGKRGALLALYTSGGVIPDRGYYHLRHLETNARIGELDEEFVWEATIGQTFTLGTQNWKIAKITHNDVFVSLASPKALAAPFWRAENRHRDYHLSCRLGQFLEEADTRLDRPDWIDTLQTRHFMQANAAKTLIDFLKQQKKSTGCRLPHRHHLVVEYVNTGPGSVPGHQVVLHTLWGGRLNHPYALALSAAWEEKYQQAIEVFPDNDCISLMLSHEAPPETLLSLVTAPRLTELLQKRLQDSGFFAARFRECAGRALLLTRRKINERIPLWMSRLRSQKLMEAVSGFKDFPIILETWRSCLQDEFDLEHLHQMLTEISSGSITWSAVHTSHPSPMARGMAWRQVNQYMYMGDKSASDDALRLSEELLKDLIFSPETRPRIPANIISDFETKRRRLAPDYSPATARDLLDWTKERHLIPIDEWQQLLQAIDRDHPEPHETMLTANANKLVKIIPENADQALIAPRETLPLIVAALYGPDEHCRFLPVVPDAPLDLAAVRSQIEAGASDPEHALYRLLGEWLQFYGPISEQWIGKTLGLAPDRLTIALEALIASRKLISGHLIAGEDDDTLCDAENFEIMLRMTRSAAAPAVEPLALEHLQLFLSAYHGITEPGAGTETLYQRLDQLLCLPVKANLWETEILPARLAPYRSDTMDRILQESDLLWLGEAKEHVQFCYETDLDLLREEKKTPPGEHASGESPHPAETTPTAAPSEHAELFSDPAGRYHFATLLRQTGRPAQTLSKQLWQGVWEGHIANDTLLALRQGIVSRFKPPRKAHQHLSSTTHRRRPRHRSVGRGAFHQWQREHHPPGNWFLVPTPQLPPDPLETEERNKARIRLLLDRYGLIFRQLLLREAPPMRWAALFRSLRIMELSGEVLAGCFFHGIAGLQFISPRALRFLQGRLPADAVYWLNAADPASVCGLGLDDLKGALPPRRPGTHLVYHGVRLVMVSQRYGKTLTFHVSPDDTELARYLAPLHHMLMRSFESLRNITVETINARPAAASPYLDALRLGFEVAPDYQNITLYRLR